MQNRFGVIQTQITNEPLITLSPGCPRQLVVADVNVDIFSLLLWWMYFLFTLFYLIDDKKVLFFFLKNLRLLSHYIVFSLQGNAIKKKCLKKSILIHLARFNFNFQESLLIAQKKSPINDSFENYINNVITVMSRF